MRFCYSCMHRFEDNGQTVCPKCGDPLDWSVDTNQYLSPGTKLQSKFIVGKCLGAGGFGNTYIGWNDLLQCKVAVKEYFPRHLSHRGEDGHTVTVSDTVQQQQFRLGLHQFLEEARSLASLQDIRGIIKVFNFFEENGTGYIVMEYLEGMDVKHILKEKGGKMDYDTSRRVILTVLHTLNDIHKKGVIHRDIAPDNVFVTNEGVIKLIDFGAAKHSADTSERKEIILKVGYAPIEQYSKTAEQGPYTDLYATAALFYRLLTGKKPQPANERVQEDHLETLSEKGISIPEQAEMAIMCSLNIQPQFRLQSAHDFMEALDGGDFEPVYEPKWILPSVPDEKEKGLFHRLPAWAKGAVIAALLALVVLGALGIVKLRDSNAIMAITEGQGSHRIPSGCVRQPEETVVEKLQKEGLEAEVTYVYDADSKEAMVTDIEPGEGSTIQEGEKVKLMVSNSEMVTVNDYSKESVSQLQKTLKKEWGNQYQESIFQYAYQDDVKKDVCYDQSVAAGETMQMSDIDSFKIYISWGSEKSYKKTMPKLTGKTVSEAKKALEDAGIPSEILQAESAREYSDSVPTDGIISQSVKEGKNVNVNQQDEKQYIGKITVTISKGAKPTATKAPTQRPETKQTQPPVKEQPAKTPKPAPFGGSDMEAPF